MNATIGGIVVAFLSGNALSALVAGALARKRSAVDTATAVVDLVHVEMKRLSAELVTTRSEVRDMSAHVLTCERENNGLRVENAELRVQMAELRSLSTLQGAELAELRSRVALLEPGPFRADPTPKEATT